MYKPVEDQNPEVPGTGIVSIPETKTPLYADETIEDLQRSKYRLIQPAYGFRFGEDSVLLAAAAVQLCPLGSRKLKVVDLGAGSGAVSMLMSARKPELNVDMIELDDHRYDCMRRNIIINGLQSVCRPYKLDLKDLADRRIKLTAEMPAPSSYDLAVMNPPYRVPAAMSMKRYEEGTIEEKSKLLAAEEIAVNLDELLSAAAWLLKPGGRIIMVHRPHRLADIIASMRKHRLEPTSLQVLESFAGLAPSRIIIAGRRNIKSGGFIFHAPLVVYDKPGEMTAQAAELYGHETPLTESERLRGLKEITKNWQEARLLDG
ncbi:MAG: tRNA1Val (adenine37-N6)-methyltransferase [Clostridiales bacterium]|jgi:tRNA1Val (adenine37-N6)-methyltransferase|nr:tRNA1Val (adenine37-N6)-methyltransferase [Clostridiales bacterium]